MIHDYTQTMHFCDQCVEAAQAARDEDYKHVGYLATHGSINQAYFLILMLCATGDQDYTVPNHKCESNNGACECGLYHEDEDEFDAEENAEEES